MPMQPLVKPSGFRYFPETALANDYSPDIQMAYGSGPGNPVPTAIQRYPGNDIQAHANGGPFYPMQPYNGLTTTDPAVLSNTAVIKDRRPYGQRRFNNIGYLDVQLKNGLGNGVMAGSMYWVGANGQRQQASPYPIGQSYVPYIPGQTRGDAGGFQKRGPSPYNVQDMMQAGPGSQPTHPGGPGTIVGTQIYNPMSG